MLARYMLSVFHTPVVLFIYLFIYLEIHSWARYTMQSKAELKWQ